jgi:hypothetical protein
METKQGVSHKDSNSRGPYSAVPWIQLPDDGEWTPPIQQYGGNDKSAWMETKPVLLLDSLLQEDASLPQASDEETDLQFDEAVNNTSDFVDLSLSFVEVPQKNTFIHYDLLKDRPETPTKSAPGILLRRLFKTKASDESTDMDMALSSISCQSVLSSSTDHSTLHQGDSDHDSEASTTDSPTEKSVVPTDGFAVEPSSDMFCLHELGQCTPCNYFWYKVDGCRQGSECVFCHYCPKGEIKKRKKDKMKQLRKSKFAAPR